MHIRPLHSCLPVILSVLLFSACAKEIPRPGQFVPVAGQGRSGPPVASESEETFQAYLHPANLNMTSWKQLEPALRNSLRYVSGKNSTDAATDATTGMPDLVLTWGDMHRTLSTLLDLLPRLDENPALFAEHFTWKAVPDGIDYSGYYEPAIRASWLKKPGYEHPIYATPPDMERLKRRGPYYDRKAIDGRKVLEGQSLELAWAADPVDVFYMQIQGSGRLIFEDGATACMNYDSQNGHKYVSIGRVMKGRELIAEGHIFEQRAWFKANPQQINDILFENPSYVFFKLGDEGAIGAMGYALEPWVSLATDRAIIPLGALVAYAVNIPDQNTDQAPLRAIGLAQDVGGAIKKNRIDIFCGLGDEGEYVASRLDQHGPAWILVAKTPESEPQSSPQALSQTSAVPAEPEDDAAPQAEAQADVAETQTPESEPQSSPQALSQTSATPAEPEDDAAPQTEPWASVTEIETAMLREDYATARQLLEDPVREGDAMAEVLLGHMLLFGRGGPADTARAEELLRRAAERGRPEAQNSMGVLYMIGINGVIDPVQGTAWFRKAAEQGHPYAMFNMGRAAEEGLNVKKSKTAALAWYAQAALKGSEAAKIRLEELQDAQAPPNKKRNMSYQLDARTQAALWPSRSARIDPAPTLRQNNEKESDDLVIRNVHLRRNKQAVTLSFRLVNTQHAKLHQGELRLALLLPDDSRTPLHVTDTAFSIKHFVTKKLHLTLPAEAPDGSRLLIEAMKGETVLHASRLVLPGP